MSKLSSRVRVSQSGLVGLFALAALSQLKLQTMERAHTIALAKKTSRYTQRAIDLARRGAILDINSRPLAQDDNTQYLELDFRKVPHNDAFYMDLSAATGIAAGEFAAMAASPSESCTWRQTISPFQSSLVRQVKQDWRADGVSMVRSGRREYPLGAAASTLVGYVREGKPLLGLETSKSAILGGANGMEVGLADRYGRFLPMREDSHSVPRHDGQNVTLTIDADLQTAASEAVREAVEANKADNGIAIVLRPRTGEILAMSTWPSFSPSNPDGSEADLTLGSGFNPAYMQALEPGSTFKILTLSKALDMGVVKMTDTVSCRGEMYVDGKSCWRVRCDDHHGNRAHGTLSPLEAIAKSCNVSAATWALKIGRPEFLRYVETLGLLRKPALGLPEESAGLFNKHDWAQQLQLANMGFGQAINTTPIALAGAFGMVANGGVLMQPTLVAKVGARLQPIRPGVRIIKKQTSDEVMKCMEAVIESDEGTGSKLRIPGYRLAGKTGTAQKIGKSSRGSQGASNGYVSNFVGFVPAQNPEAEILVMINHPTNGNYYGASVAGPVFKEIARAVIRRYAIPPTEPTERVAMRSAK